MEHQLPAQVGRPPSTTKGGISDVGIALFVAKGFDETSVDDIAEAAGIARRTFFRYFPSKNAVPWGDFDDGLALLRRLLSEIPREVPLADAILDAILQFNTFPEDERPTHRRRMRLILEVPALQSYSTIMYQGWRHVIAEFVATRTGRDSEDLIPRTCGWLALGTAISAYEQWLVDEDADLHDLLRAAAQPLRHGLADAAEPGDDTQ
ncbi:mycofactocin system transcriptional regulator [Rhodococcus sp. BP-149]|uniref:mycofactocin system transcriptional regulator n=1 Tax=unclassified Rhodococcus (in: high G+C Gram-positive bacteria) TaxID=192944 RepID=UPI001C9B2FF5|nr:MULTISPECIES: mycofactocin system transcriptional regulator [unclassified Rhodococcus (in: high G+C Gram-positive bacteria)]MBY6687822.1 mycofactocin system transcriptional regulator [Rhodococcus sp. BP-288]MBY6696087.1 mycofactocin system transcriptional regulator [Rhodococcus sp. BP-188]MBY6700684.1 mycofactocin system transcriptional regulator [Rhodococcus sp. BP-285]MBY6705081.1 mycofactocin system transcriptional regulator [Rhodococcus sp. BP-283]MBY6713809.1 mycofactocin system transc